MRVSVSDAKGQLTELVKRAESGDEVILTRRGHEVARLVPITVLPSAQSRRALMERVRIDAAGKARSGPDAARSQDFLYDEGGLPG
ncbi:MAG: type II toxin-antitoxin system prevent-host-death family antitoxin [Parvibaculum sp.]|nr:type II toxin-antitoxin system prevent-host-death family antitoxin [Parvibaculum sp.]